MKNFAAEFIREVRNCAQYSSAAHQNRTWQNLNLLTINAEKRQERIKESIKFMKRRWLNETMNQLMLEIRDHHVADEIVKLIKKYFINFEKIMKRLQLTVLKCKKKMNRNIRTTAVYILNDFKRAYNKIYSNLFASTRKNFCAVDLMIRDMKLIKNSQTNIFSDIDFVENFLVTVSRIDIIETDISILSTRAVVFKFSISKIISVTSRKTLQVERINQSNKSNVVSSAVNSILF